MKELLEIMSPRLLAPSLGSTCVVRVISAKTDRWREFVRNDLCNEEGEEFQKLAKILEQEPINEAELESWFQGNKNAILDLARRYL